MGETRVDLQHLLEDLRDAYPGSLEETILTEIIANSLDSGASEVRLSADPTQAALTVLDNGTGMQRRNLAKYHDIAASTKVRGMGIGFAGVGIKLGLLVCEAVVTETRRGNTHVATTWHLASRHRAPWKWIPSQGLVRERGTAVRLTLHNALSPLLDPGFLESTVRRHFLPLVDPAFEAFLANHYPAGIRFHINGQIIQKMHEHPGDRAHLEIRMLRKRKPSAIGYLLRTEQPLPHDQRGVAVSTFGKVIKRGWDWLGLSPAAHDSIGGLIEVPELASSLTLNKGDFIRSGSRGAMYLAYRKAIQEAVSNQLTIWGDTRQAVDQERPKMTRPLERDLERVLENMVDMFPLLSSLVDRQVGGQKPLPFGSSGEVSEGKDLVTALVASQAEKQQDDDDQEKGPLQPPQPEGLLEESKQIMPATTPTENITLPGQERIRRPARLGLTIQFDDRPGDPEIGRFVESTVWVNRSHPAYHRAETSRALGYHVAIAVALALAPLAVEPAKEHAFVTAFLSCWGEALKPQASRNVRRR